MSPATLDVYGHMKHWDLVEEYIIGPALRDAGYEVKSPEARGATLIHGSIIRELKDANLVIADFSGMNPNVLFEAGVRTAMNKPLVIIAEQGTSLPFDTASINTFFYDPSIRADTVKADVRNLASHVGETASADNALWRHFGVEVAAAESLGSGDPRDAQFKILSERLEQLIAVSEVDRMSHPEPPVKARREPWYPPPNAKVSLLLRLGDEAGVRDVFFQAFLDSGEDVELSERLAEDVARILYRLELTGMIDHSDALKIQNARAHLAAVDTQGLRLVLKEALLAVGPPDMPDWAKDIDPK